MLGPYTPNFYSNLVLMLLSTIFVMLLFFFLLLPPGWKQLVKLTKSGLKREVAFNSEFISIVSHIHDNGVLKSTDSLTIIGTILFLGIKKH